MALGNYVFPQLFCKFRAFSPLRATAAPEQKGIELVVSAAMSILASPAAASRLFVVRDDSVESKNEADVYIHGFLTHPTISGFPRHFTEGDMIQGSGMWLGKLELGEHCRHLVAVFARE